MLTAQELQEHFLRLHNLYFHTQKNLNTMAKKKSKMGSINLNDVVKGLLIAVSASVLAAAQQMLLTTPPQLDFKQIGIVALISAIAYLGKQFTTNSDGDLMSKEVKKQSYAENN